MTQLSKLVNYSDLIIFLLGLAFPAILFGLKMIYHYYQFYKFRKMIKKEYMDPLFKSKNIHDETGTTLERLTYLKDNELVYLNSDIQIKYVRYIVFCISVCNSAYDVSVAYGYRDIKDSKTSELEQSRLDKILKCFSDVFDNKSKNYYRLKADYFISPDELKKLENYVRNGTYEK